MDKSQRPLTEKCKRVICTYAENDMNATATARALNINNSTVEFHLTAAKEKTGINPRSFFGLIALLETIEETT